MSNAVQLAVGAYLSGRNKIINGRGLIAQRANAAATSGQLYGGPDRFKVTNSAGGTCTQSQGTFTLPNGLNRTSIQHSATAIATNNSGLNYWSGIQQNIEGYNTIDLVGVPISVSFWFQATVAGVYTATLLDGLGIYTYLYNFTVAANTPTFVSFTTPPNANIGWSALNASGLVLRIGAQNVGTYQTSAANVGQWIVGAYFTTTATTAWNTTLNAVIKATEIQVEAGPIVTPFENLNIIDEISHCNRYFWKSYNQATLPGSANVDTNAYAWFTGPTLDANCYQGVEASFPTPMRTSPTCIVYSPHTGASGKAYAQNSAVDLTASVSQGDEKHIWMQLVNQSVAARDIIKFHAAADAEL